MKNFCKIRASRIFLDDAPKVGRKSGENCFKIAFISCKKFSCGLFIETNMQVACESFLGFQFVRDRHFNLAL